VSFEGTFSAAAGGISKIRSEVSEIARLCGLDEKRVNEVALAVSEAATNAIVHGYRGDPGLIHVSAERANGELTILVTDEGLGMGPRLDSPGLGLGLPIIAKLTQRFDVISKGSGTRIHMVFDCPACAEAA
jgi:serine/threonine-protein kinase RsbW